MTSTTTIKVFAGNLPFSTNDDQLKAMFAPIGTVVSAAIIYRGTRSLGYGFVEMDNESSAKKAVDLMNKTTIDGRQINVEIARPRPAGETPQRTGGGATSAGAAGSPGAADGARRRRNRTRRGPPRAGGEGGDNAASATGGSQPGRTLAAPRADRQQSQTTVFVANLPFTLDSAGLLNAFKAVKAVDAVVATRKLGRSKGFGFVLFGSNADQQKAIAAMDGKLIETRAIAVKAAVTEFAAEKSRSEQQAVRPAPAPATAATAAAPAAAGGVPAAARASPSPAKK